ncbi:YceI family protein [Psychrosphaera algicola]|uniref:YceI family protein n=1 Tax=Psychrosphaera algicola TaxID=3023714 RepID=A0ABT5F8F3_9GAMM|nr:YceI family protein [Psychrosphaera sp. G1-22]MDC2887821.1 YceI family protein [Psychrosphaera sp. G1-22]
MNSKMITNLAMSALMMSASAGVFADYKLDNDNSAFHFLSTKKQTTTEVHQFTQLSGTINKQGLASLSIDLNSVESNIEIRNQRMTKELFETNLYPQAVFTTQVKPSVYENLTLGEHTTTTIEGMLSLHGISQKITTEVMLVKGKNKTLTISTIKPLVINSDQFQLTGGIDKLKQLAGLSSISYSVPITFSLAFSHQ